MYRKMRRFKQQLSDDECKKILMESKRAVLSMIGDDGLPYGVPMNYTYDENENAIYLHCAKEGHKIDAMKKCDKISFATWQNITKTDLGWEVGSVIIFGKAIFIDDMNIVEKQLASIGYKYHDSEEYVKSEIERNLNKVQIIKIEIEHMTGKYVNEW